MSEPYKILCKILRNNHAGMNQSKYEMKYTLDRNNHKTPPIYVHQNKHQTPPETKIPSFSSKSQMCTLIDTHVFFSTFQIFLFLSKTPLSHTNITKSICSQQYSPTSPIYQEEKIKIPLEIIFLPKHDFHISPPFDINLKGGE